MAKKFLHDKASFLKNIPKTFEFTSREANSSSYSKSASSTKIVPLSVCVMLIVSTAKITVSWETAEFFAVLS